MPFLLLFLLFFLSLPVYAGENDSIWGLKNTPQELSSDKTLEFWAYQNQNSNESHTDIMKLRYYNPLNLGSWQGRLRLDTSMVATNTNSGANNIGQFSAGNTMLTVWGQDKDFLPNFNAAIGARLVFPFGNNGQWAVGPQIRWLFKPQEGSNSLITDFSPSLRYMYGFNTKNNSFQINPNQPILQRNLQIYPTLGIEITATTQLRLWDENGILFNSAGGGWFIPIDAMIVHKLTKKFSFAIGASKQVIDTYQQYNWSLYGKASYTF